MNELNIFQVLYIILIMLHSDSEHYDSYRSNSNLINKLLNYKNNLPDKDSLFYFMIRNNSSYMNKHNTLTYKNNNIKLSITRDVNMLSELVIIINKKNCNFTIDLIDNISVNFAKLKTINYTVEEHNIIF
jgi:hypothetical protein